MDHYHQYLFRDLRFWGSLFCGEIFKQNWSKFTKESLIEQGKHIFLLSFELFEEFLITVTQLVGQCWTLLLLVPINIYIPATLESYYWFLNLLLQKRTIYCSSFINKLISFLLEDHRNDLTPNLIYLLRVLMQKFLICIIFYGFIFILTKILEYFSPFLLRSCFLVHLSGLCILQLWQLLFSYKLNRFLWFLRRYALLYLLDLLQGGL